LSGYGLALDAVRGFDRDVVEKLKENLDLARESVRSGKIGLLLFNSVRRDLVDTRLAYLDALSELVEARSALELAAGGAWSDA
jgi:outer membrane protein TolC